MVKIQPHMQNYKWQSLKRYFSQDHFLIDEFNIFWYIK